MESKTEGTMSEIIKALWNIGIKSDPAFCLGQFIEKTNREKEYECPTYEWHQSYFCVPKVLLNWFFIVFNGEKLPYRVSSHTWLQGQVNRVDSRQDIEYPSDQRLVFRDCLVRVKGEEVVTVNIRCQICPLDVDFQPLPDASAFAAATDLDFYRGAGDEAVNGEICRIFGYWVSRDFFGIRGKRDVTGVGLEDRTRYDLANAGVQASLGHRFLGKEGPDT